MRHACPSIYARRVNAPAARSYGGRDLLRAFSVAAAVAIGALGLTACGSDDKTPTTVTAPAASVATTAPAVVSTRFGQAEYRSVGNGPPLVMVMGFGSSMEDWDPAFVDQLAKTHRVVIFNNAGIGKSSAVPGKLTMSVLGDRVSALVDALKLGRVDVLGWSMGGMISQAFAVRHPPQVRRLILAATKPGNGKSKEIDPAVAKAHASLGLDAFVAALFPADQKAAAKAYGAGIASYEEHAKVPDALYGAQRAAIVAWGRGDDAAGPLLRFSKLKTLVAAGRDDTFIRVQNSRLLAKLLRNSELKLYDDAGHAFLFQPDTKFAARVNAFLAGRG